MKLVPALLFLLLGAATAAAGQPRGVDTRLQEVQRRMEGVRQISGTFTQTKKLEFLKEPVVSNGRFFFDKPGALTWEYLSPAPSGMKIVNGAATVWNGPPAARVVQPGAMSRPAKMMADQVMMWMNFRPRDILAVYEVKIVTENPLSLKVMPKRDGLRKFLKSITVLLADDVRTVRSVVLEEDGATTTLDFADVAFDRGPPPGMTE